MRKYDIYGLGAALVDTEIEVNDQDLNEFKVDKGLMTLVDEARQSELLNLLEGHLITASRASGGSAANSIIAAQYFGASTFYSCKVANDDNGQFYLSDLSDAGVAYSEKSVAEDGITGKCLVMITPDAERTMNTFLGVSESLSVTQIDEAALKASNFVYLEGYLVTSASARPAAVKVRELAEANGVKTALSLSDPGIVEFFHEGLSEMIGDQVDILFCNRDEALKFTKTGTLEEAATALGSIARSYAITLGADGALVFDGADSYKVPSPKVKAVDTNGAGDMFAGAFLYALSQNCHYEKAAEFANRAAAKVVSQFGPRLTADQYKEFTL